MHVWRYILYFCAVMVCANAKRVDKVKEQPLKTGPRSSVTAFEFISSPEIYLLKSNVSFKRIKCIGAKTLEKVERRKSLEQMVFLKFKHSHDWITMNATYQPVTKKEKVKEDVHIF
uniref:Putative secreted protein n=1 Tax=Amblyomma triste TaxID=251400 RepID=A0A023G9H7_AMBTT